MPFLQVQVASFRLFSRGQGTDERLSIRTLKRRVLVESGGATFHHGSSARDATQTLPEPGSAALTCPNRRRTFKVTDITLVIGFIRAFSMLEPPSELVTF